METSLPEETTIEVRFSATKAIWFDMVFVAGRQGRVVEVSDAMWDAGQLPRWLEAIVDGRRGVMECDREGIIDEVWSEPVDEDRVRLTISAKWQDDEIYLDAVVGRRKLVWEVYFELARIDRLFADNGASWRSGWWRVPTVEAWLDWERTGQVIEIHDVVAGRSRLGDPVR